MEKQIFKYESIEPTVLVAIQVYDCKEWGETPPTFHEIPKGEAGKLAKFVANSLKTQVRLTYPRSQYDDVSRLNGCYISWDQFVIS